MSWYFMYSTGLRPGHNVHLAYVQCCCSESDFYFEIVLKHYIDLNFQNACAHSSSVCHRKWKSHLSQSLRCLKANLSERQRARCVRLPAARCSQQPQCLRVTFGLFSVCWGKIHSSKTGKAKRFHLLKQRQSK